MKLVLASKNAHKLVEMRDILSQLGVEVVLESEVGVDVDVEETGATFEENAFLKARAVMEASGLPAIADDSGLCVDALNGAPGVYSARYGGPGLDDVGRYRLLLENMRGQLDRRCRFVSAICCCFPNGDRVEARGLIKGKVLENSLLSSREAAEALASATRSQVVQVIGTKFVLYRPTHKKDKKDKIVLVTDRKRK